MEKLINVTLLFIFILSITFTSKAQEITAKISGNLFNVPSDTVYISQNLGAQGMKDLAMFLLDKKGNFSEKIKLPAEDYYVLRLSDGQSINLVIRDKDDFKVFGDGKNLFQFANIVGSDDSQALNEFIRFNMAYNQKLDSAKLYLQQNPGKDKEVNASFQPVYNSFRSERQQFMTEFANSPALIAVLGTFNLDQEFKEYEQTVEALKENFSNSPTVQNVAQELEKNKQLRASKAPLSLGAKAKDIVMANPEGTEIKLSDYEGKIVLLDFWASWCGPCRKENPHVVKLYEKYKDAGFTVFSVSLDKNKASWLAAIEKDKLVWDAHVSDLQGWQNAAAKQYQVSSIPFTVLLDREGKVIQTKLRGYQLEQMLESIFGF